MTDSSHNNLVLSPIKVLFVLQEFSDVTRASGDTSD